jgi:hypothetical protein
MAGSNGPTTALMGIHPDPMGTPDELRQFNIDPRAAGSCAKPDGSAGVRGCPHWDRCIFRMARWGDFRGNGPRGVGYVLVTHEGSKKEDDAYCYWYMSRLHDRARAGQMQREEGKNGELIQIVALEPGLNHRLSNEVIHRAYTVNTNEGKVGLPAVWEKKRFTGPVKPFPRLGTRQGDSETDSLIQDRIRLRELREEALIDAGDRLTDEDIKQPVVPDEFAEPEVEVKRGPGRPRKHPLATAEPESA